MKFTYCPNCKTKLKNHDSTKKTINHTNGDKTEKYTYIYKCEECDSTITINKELYLTKKENKLNKKKSKDKKSLSQ